MLAVHLPTNIGGIAFDLFVVSSPNYLRNLSRGCADKFCIFHIALDVGVVYLASPGGSRARNIYVPVCLAINHSNRPKLHPKTNNFASVLRRINKITCIILWIQILFIWLLLACTLELSAASYSAMGYTTDVKSIDGFRHGAGAQLAEHLTGSPAENCSLPSEVQDRRQILVAHAFRQPIFINSTRRFRARPSSVSFVSFGCDLP
jgi:hypothetical protein